MKLEAFAIKSPSGFKITARKTFEDGLNSLADGNYTVTVEKRVKKRSNGQNSYYWVLIKIIKDALRELGHDVDEKETHYMLRERLLYSELVNEETGEVARIVKSTQKLSTTEFNEYLENVKRFCAEWLKLVLPDPDTQLEINIDRNE